MNGTETAREKRIVRRQGARSAPKSLIPRLALWAGVGVFVLALALLAACGDDDGPTEPTPTPPKPSGEGFVWAATDNVFSENWLIKVDVGTGEIHHRGVKGFETGEWTVGIPTVPETGDFFLHNPGVFLARYDANGGKIWREGSTRYNWRDFTSIGYYKRGNAIWGMEDWSLEKYNGSNGDPLLMKQIGGLILKPHSPLQVDQNTGAVWAASPNYLIKLSANGTKLYDEEFNTVERSILNLAIENRTGNLWVLVRVGRPAEKYRLLKYSPEGDRLLAKDTFLIQEPMGMAVDRYTGEVWLGYQYGVVVHKSNGDYKKSVPNYNNVRAFAFTDTRVIMGGGEKDRSYCLYGVNKGTGRELWSITGGYRPAKCVSYVKK